MKRLVIKLVLFGAVMVFALAGTLALRTYLWQDKVREHFKIKPGTLALCIGNSHAECSWVEVPGSKIKNSFEVDTVFPMFLWRLKEFDRRGQLQNAKNVIVIYDQTAFRCHEKRFAYRYRMAFAYQWRYFFEIPPRVDSWNCLLDTMTHLGSHWGVAGAERKGDDVPIDITAKPRFLAQEKSGEKVDYKAFWEGQEREVRCELEEMRDICRRNGVHLMLLWSPLCSELRQRDTSDGVDVLYDGLAELAREVGVDCIDERAWAPDYLFRDASHLSFAGAKKFSCYFFEKYCGWHPIVAR